jgi:hypothetical protein
MQSSVLTLQTDFDQGTVTLIQRGLISRCPGPRRHRLSGDEIDNARLVEGYCSRFYCFRIAGSGISRWNSPQFT